MGRAERVKGRLLAGVAEALHGTIASGRISRAEAEARLPAAAVKVLEEKVDVVEWYPVEAYRELLDLLWMTQGGGDPEFMRGAGAVCAQELIDSRLYQAFFDAASGRGGGIRGLQRRMQITCRLSDLLYDFLEMSFEVDEERDEVRIVYQNVESFSEAMFLGTQGFLEGFSRVTAGADGSDATTLRWHAERPEPCRMVFSRGIGGLLSAD